MEDRSPSESHVSGSTLQAASEAQASEPAPSPSTSTSHRQPPPTEATSKDESRSNTECVDDDSSIGSSSHQPSSLQSPNPIDSASKAKASPPQTSSTTIAGDASLDFLSLQPPDIWTKIMSNISSRHLCAARQASKQMREHVNSSVRKMKLDPSYSHKVLSWHLATHFPFVEHFEVGKPSMLDAFTDPLFAQLALKELSRMPRLTSANLEHCMLLTAAGVSALALAAPNLTQLTLPHVCRLNQTDTCLLVLKNLPQLTKLRLKCCKGCSDLNLASHLSSLSSITSLELEDYGHALKDVSALSCLSTLRSIMVWSDAAIDVTNAFNHFNNVGGVHQALGGGLAAQHLPHQQDHHHHHHHNIPFPAFIHHMHGHQHAPLPLIPVPVGAMGVVEGGGEGAAGVAAVAAALIADGQPHGGAAIAAAAAALFAHQMEAQDIYLQIETAEAALNDLISGRTALLNWVVSIPSLTHVDVQRVDIDDSDLLRFTALKQLKHLGVGDLRMESDPLCSLASVTKLVVHNVLNEQHISKAFPNLEALSCDASDASLTHISLMTSLSSLFLWNSQQPELSITNAGLAVLDNIPLLHTFRLEGTSEVHDEGWFCFASSHPSLTKLDLVGMSGMSPVGLILACGKLPKLQLASFSELQSVMDSSVLAAMLSLCPMRRLEISDCESITREEVKKVLNSLRDPDLEIVYSKGGAISLMYCPTG
eukprot:gene22757-29925_t